MKGVLLGLLALCLLPGGALGLKECKSNLVRFFGLKGSKYPTRHEFHVCPNLSENCCALTDEPLIYYYWKEHSMVNIKRYISDGVKLYSDLFSLRDRMIDVPFARVETSRTTVQDVPVKQQVCERFALQSFVPSTNLASIDLLNNNHILDMPGFDARLVAKAKSLEDLGIIEQHNERESDFVAGPRLVKKKPSTGFSKRNLVQVPEKKMKKAKKLSEEQLKSESKAENSKEVEHKKKARRLKKTEKKEEDKNGKDEDQPKTKVKKDRRLQIVSKRKLNDSPENDSEVQKFDELSFGNPEEEKEFRKIVAKKREKAKRKLQTAIRHPLFFKEDLPKPKIQCSETVRMVKKSVTIVNNAKKEYCMNLQSSVKDFRVDDFYSYIPLLKTEMVRLLSMKKSFYCALCDSNQQVLINEKQQTITFEPAFCRNFIKEFKDYIRFQNIILIEYMDSLLQYARCFQSTADTNQFPSPNFLDSYKRFFPVIENCFAHLDKENFLEKCLPLCDQYSYTTKTTFFDGNFGLVKKILLYIKSFLRKAESSSSLSIDYAAIELNFEKIDKIDFNDPYFQSRELHTRNYSEEKKKELEEKLKDMFLADSGVNEVEEEQVHFYEAEGAKGSSKYFSPKFENVEFALNPLNAENDLVIDFSMENLIQEQCKEKEAKEEKLKPSTIKSYFQVNTKDIDDFQNDLFLPLTDYSFFKSLEKSDKDSQPNETHEIGKI